MHICMTKTTANTLTHCSFFFSRNYIKLQHGLSCKAYGTLIKEKVEKNEQRLAQQEEASIMNI